MNKALLVIDMQRLLVGKDHAKIFKYDNETLLRNVNRRISCYPPENVYYILNLMKRNLINRLAPAQAYDGDPAAELADELSVVSANVYKKFDGNAFTNPDLAAKLRASGITELDIIGVDGCGCVPRTAEGGLREGFTARILSGDVATMSPKRAAKQRARITALGVKYVDQ